MVFLRGKRVVRFSRYACLILAVAVVGVGCDKRPRRGGPPIHQAARDGDAGRVQSLLGRGTDVNAKDSRGRTPLHWATLQGRTEVATMLVAAGADINAKAANAETVLHMATSQGR
jgi:ankyrin repeat protein